MSHWNEWLSSDVLRSMALALLHFVWQGAALAALASLLLAVCRRASTRYAIAVVALVAMAAAPVATFLTLRNADRRANLPVTDQVGGAALGVAPLMAGHSREIANPQSERPTVPAASLAWLVQIWFAGVLLFSVRTAGGLVVIARMRRRETTPVEEKLLAMCVSLQHNMGLTRVIRYCESLQLDAPAVAGWFRPVVFLPAAALTGLSEAQLETVIAHELAHVRRLDGLVNLFQIAVETLLFYHPGVWWISKRVRAEREHCCDDEAIALCGNAVEYARALALMEEWRTAPALAMAANAHPLAARVARLLGITTFKSELRNAGLAAGVLCLTAALLAGNALFGGTHASWNEQDARQQTSPSPDDGTFVITAARPAKAPKARRNSTLAPAAPTVELTSAAPEANPSPASSQVVALTRMAALTAPQQPSGAPAASSYIEQMKAAGIENPSVDDLVAMKIQGITPEYVRLMKELGIAPQCDQLIGMKVQGITPTYVREMREVVGQNLGGDELIGLKVQGVTSEYVKQMKDLGLKVDADEIIGLKVQGVTPAYIQELRGLGLKADGDGVIGMKVQGITPEYVKSMQALGLKPDVDELVGMKVQGITPGYVKSMQELGLKPTVDELIGMKVQGIQASYLKEMQAAGFKMDIDDAIGAKVQGVTPEFISKARSYGFKDLTLQQIIRLKQSGVLDKQK
jgi:beta-lactamase regulating signal transducer with metallopeptidase domain